ncbi:arylamine N-acetyltransferase 2 [Podospora didyma]|uniref:Arylamine N-acetyltransferase 2 n=1 Tax=Podospora didyma TaxID=330526 RepID=A0AAE0KJC0_9PEZI|nr:arylamine N-acetyltransferase 2 [Podospora didyma]
MSSSVETSDSAYSSSQVSEYLSHIGLPPSFHPSANPVLDLTYLTTLFVHQITAIPYENLVIHYSLSHAVDLDPQAVFTKVVRNRRGRGGYCMENSILFNHMLRALGFTDAYTAGVRIRMRDPDNVPAGPYIGYVHLVNIVRLSSDGQKYALDVGFGGDGPTLPMPLVAGLVHHNSIGTQEIRYVHDCLPATPQRRGRDKNWIYEYRNGPDREWNAFYAFAEFEFFEPDFQVINYYTSQAPTSAQSYRPIVVRFLRGDGDDGRVKVVGKVMLMHGDVKRNVSGRTELVKTCVSERERVEALSEYFGIELTEEEAGGIKGFRSELLG